MAVLQDLTKLDKDQLIALLTKERAKVNGPKIAWAKDKDGDEKVGLAVNMTWPGKRSRYLEVSEIEYIMDHADQIQEQLVAMIEG